MMEENVSLLYPSQCYFYFPKKYTHKKKKNQFIIHETHRYHRLCNFKPKKKRKLTSNLLIIYLYILLIMKICGWTFIVLIVCVLKLTNTFDDCYASKIDTPSLLSSVKSRLLERRRLNAMNMNHNNNNNDQMNKNSHRKMMKVTDLSSVVDGKYIIIIFDPDSVENVTNKSLQLFTSSQILYVYDNIAIKGVAIQNVTMKRLYEFESDPDILSIEPVRDLFL